MGWRQDRVDHRGRPAASHETGPGCRLPPAIGPERPDRQAPGPPARDPRSRDERHPAATERPRRIGLTDQTDLSASHQQRARVPVGLPVPTRREATCPLCTPSRRRPRDDRRWKIVETRMRRMGDRPAALIEALHAAQEAFGYLDEGALHFVGDTLGVPALARLRRGDLLLLLHAQAAGRAHLRRVHGDRLLHQRRRRRSWPASSEQLGVKPKQTTADGKVSAADGALPRRLQPGAGRDHRR